MSILNHQLWPEIAKHVKIEKYAPDGGYKNPRFRLEFKKDATDEQKKKWLAITVPCVACGEPIHPIRKRKPASRGSGVGHLYIAPCCPLSVNIACSRGEKAHLEYLAIRAEVEKGNR